LISSSEDIVQRMKHTGLTVIGLALSLATGAVQADVVAVVSSKSAVTTLSKNQVADIFLGKAARFPNGSPAVPIDQAEASIVREAFYTKFTGKSAAQMKAHWSKIIFTGRGKPPRVVSNSLEARTLIAANPQAIGYIERDSVDGSVKVLLQQ
jgi:ABC-type phosphate transport system substrate-binding protein